MIRTMIMSSVLVTSILLSGCATVGWVNPEIVVHQPVEVYVPQPWPNPTIRCVIYPAWIDIVGHYHYERTVCAPVRVYEPTPRPRERRRR